ncbi:MAG: carbon storage regulator [Planctomycetaceae bacterium]|jgi:carbon storage regulator
MLVLSRKVGESIQIDGDIRVTVTQVRGGRVRLSITAPPSVRVAREEILHKFADLAVQEADLECDRENSQVL